jgi:YHS domain-containing protein
MNKETNCADCDDHVQVQRNTPKKLQGGVIYHFCSEECRDRFVQDPSEHTGSSPRRSQAGLP